MALACPGYSSVCDTDSQAYRAYLVLYAEYLHRSGNGEHFGFFGRGDGGSDRREVGGGSVDVGSRVVGSESGGFGGSAGSVGDLDVGSSCRVGRIGDCFGGSVGDSGKSGESGAIGISLGDIASGVDRLASVAPRAVGTDASVGVGQSVPLGCVAGDGYGAHHARNVKKRAAKRERARAGRDVVPEWRRGAGSGVGERQGFFSSASDVTKDALRDSRAALLVERNKRQLLQERSLVRKLESPVALVKEALDALTLVASIKKGPDAKVAGWAATVVDSYTSSLSGSGSSDKAGKPATDATSVSVNSSVSVDKHDRWSFSRVNANAAERLLIGRGFFSVEQVIAMRVKAGRVFHTADMYSGSCKLLVKGFSREFKAELERAEVAEEQEDDDYYH